MKAIEHLPSLKASPDCPATLSYKGRRPTNTEKRLLGKHFPYKSSRRGRCVVCCNKVTSQGKKDTKTMNFCPKCEVHLCNGSCFEAYHTMSKYWADYVYNVCSIAILHVFMMHSWRHFLLVRFLYVGYMYSWCIPAEISLCWLHVFLMHSRWDFFMLVTCILDAFSLRFLYVGYMYSWWVNACFCWSELEEW